ncbi:sigma-54-dependent transcriptional regulator [Clostridium sp. MCC353]|uniref:sigma-54-dependent transcriptional regulator n=1 Tax=Clostridium sp. MCC353 TaxID=2592646 RepID=UPI001C015589|nr:sigma-54-dependent transcriptional regulator [Clostridium sp. MCC353]MBT9776944.1 sigma-54-dependent transcriptional regulator [Clostridium sp. MCC353]
MLLLITPYPGLKEVALAVVEEYGYKDIDIYVGNYQKAPELIRALNADQKYEAVITRGGTVNVCRTVTRLPVIEIRITAFDILRILKLAEGYTGKKAFLASENLTEEFSRFGSLMESDVDAFSYNEHAQVEGLVGVLKQQGYELIIGDHIVYNSALEMGMNSMLLTSGPEGVRDAVEEAERLCLHLRNAKKGETAGPHRREPAPVFPADREMPTRWQEVSNLLIVSRISQMSAGDVHTVFPKSQLEMIKDYSRTPFPTIISGRDGTCKNDAGYLCCCFGRKKKGVFIRLDCCAVSENQDFGLLDEALDALFGTEGGILFLEDIDRMKTEAQKKMVRILRKLEKNKELKLIASCELPVDECVANKMLLRPLQAVLDEVRIELKPLKEYSREIKNMISVYLGKLDMACGNYSAGIDRSGLEQLEQYGWPGNTRQFMRVLNHLVLGKKGMFIKDSDVKQVLMEEGEGGGSHLVSVDLNGSLSEIEERIIRRVMEEEGMNQSRVERRLQIGHSTLWRKLNKKK